jgi:ketosteroid isomerase-like protein
VAESENVRATREIYASWNRGDLEAVLAATPSDWEFRTNASIPGVPGIFRGPEGARELFNVWFTEPWEGNLHMELNHVVEVDDERVLALITFRGRGEGSGVPVELRYAHLARLRDGQAVELEGFPSWERGLEAAGLERVPDHATAEGGEGP